MYDVVFCLTGCGGQKSVWLAKQKPVTVEQCTGFLILGEIVKRRMWTGAISRTNGEIQLE
jgi:hypothetical protein